MQHPHPWPTKRDGEELKERPNLSMQFEYIPWISPLPCKSTQITSRHVVDVFMRCIIALLSPGMSHIRDETAAKSMNFCGMCNSSSRRGSNRINICPEWWSLRTCKQEEDKVRVSVQWIFIKSAFDDPHPYDNNNSAGMDMDTLWRTDQQRIWRCDLQYSWILAICSGIPSNIPICFAPYSASDFPLATRPDRFVSSWHWLATH